MHTWIIHVHQPQLKWYGQGLYIDVWIKVMVESIGPVDQKLLLSHAGALLVIMKRGFYLKNNLWF